MYAINCSAPSFVNLYEFIGESEYQQGDLFAYQEDIFFCIGEKNFSSQETKKIPFNISHVTYHHKCFLSSQSCALIDRMVGEYYSKYETILGLFLGNDTKSFVTATQPEKKTRPKPINLIHYDQHQQIFTKSNEKVLGQYLFVFPDLRSLFGAIPPNLMNDDDLAILHANSTINQYQKVFFSVHQGVSKNVFVPSSQIFLDRQHLKKISVFQPHKRYYKSQQDPRYNTLSVIEHIATIHSVEIEYIGANSPRIKNI